MAVVSHGVRFGLRATRAGALESWLDHLPPGWKPASSPAVQRLYSLVVGDAGPSRGVRKLHLLYAGARRLARGRELEPVLEALAADIRRHVAEEAPRRVFVHAGVVGWRGRAVIIPGRSFTGKSTLVAALIKQGAVYYSDEYAVLDARGWVHPFPKALCLRAPGEVQGTECSVESLGGVPGDRSLPVGLVLVTRYRQGAGWRPRPLSSGEGALALLANTVSARRRPERALATLRRAVAGAVILKGDRGEVAAVAANVIAEARLGRGSSR